MTKFQEMVCGDEGDDFVCGYPMYADSKTKEPLVLELYRARGAAAKDLITNRLRHNALTILRHMVRERAKPDMMHYPLPVQAMAPFVAPMDTRTRSKWHRFL